MQVPCHIQKDHLAVDIMILWLSLSLCSPLPQCFLSPKCKGWAVLIPTVVKHLMVNIFCILPLEILYKSLWLLQNAKIYSMKHENNIYLWV